MNIFIAVIKDNLATLTPEESWHCSKVLRKKAGESIGLIDGAGHFYKAVLEAVSEKQCLARITEGPVAQEKRNYCLHLAIAPTKQMDRMEWMIEKAVEIGIDEISFMQCKNSERVVVKTDRIEKIVESAVKQSLQAFIPKINGLRSFKEMLGTKHDQGFIGHCFEAEKIPVKNIDFKNRSTLVLIGPEGDFTQEEVSQAHNVGFKGVSLGTNRLRTETAGLYVCQAAALLS